MMTWAEFEPALRYRMDAVIEARRPIADDTDGGPVGLDADVILARLIGHDGQVDDDTLRLPDVPQSVDVPLRLRPTPAIDPDPTAAQPARVARYVLQSGFATTNVDASGHPVPEGVTPGPTCLFSVAFVRYRRRIRADGG